MDEVLAERDRLRTLINKEREEFHQTEDKLVALRKRLSEALAE